MNERIKELAEKADAIVYKRYFDQIPAQFPGNLQELEKFAKLIIDHAVECVRDVLRDETSDLSYEAAGQVQERIKHYFGVKE